MTARIVESVPNFSEGRRPEVIEEIVSPFKGRAGVRLLDVKPDASHNRVVVTAIGDPDPLADAVFDAVAIAARVIDLRTHAGEHPRMGAADVIPFIPVSGVDMKGCVEIATRLGERIGRDLAIPVYLYEAAARTKARENLATIRKGEFEGLAAKMNTPDWAPDFGPATPHPSAGASVVGAREFLIAFNVNLGTADLEIANRISKAVRGSSGGFVNVKAMGVALADRGIVQVSMNLTNYRKTPIFRVYEAVCREAARYGVPVVGSELIGLAPQDALLATAEWFLKLEAFEPRQVLENHLIGPSDAVS